MKTVVLFDPSYGTLNMGDFIINESVMREMDFLFNSSFLIRYGTHNPITHHLQMLRHGGISKSLKDANYKILGGTNLLKRDLFHLTSGWNIDILTSRYYSNSVALGCGIDGDFLGNVNRYTKSVYGRALSKDIIHSVRDEPSKKFLESMGYEAYNTGCPTIWRFDDELNSSIPQGQGSDVIFTLTDYKQDFQLDQELIDILNRSYRNVYYWVQGSGDLAYLRKFSNAERIKIVGPSLEAYESVLLQGDIDYVGTRLHAGIYAMQHGVRSVILGVDNRARDMHVTHNLNVLERDLLFKLEEKLSSDFATKVTVDHELIEMWKAQFK